MPEDNRQVQYVVVVNKKSMAVAVLLTVLFGPLGLFYSSIVGGLIMVFLGGALVAGAPSPSAASSAAFVGWIICVVWSVVAVLRRNSKLPGQ